GGAVLVARRFWQLVPYPWSAIQKKVAPRAVRLSDYPFTQLLRRVGLGLVPDGDGEGFPVLQADLLRTLYPPTALRLFRDYCEVLAEHFRRQDLSPCHEKDESADRFPGAVPAAAPRLPEETFVIDRRGKGGGDPEWLGTGLYAPPGEEIVVFVTSSGDPALEL